MDFTILGAPRTKKNHGRLVRVRGKLRHLPSAAYERWARSAVKQLATAWFEPPLREPAHVRAVFYRDRSVGDLVNYMQALADALEESGVIENDRQIVSWDGTRMFRDAAQPRIEFVISPSCQTNCTGRTPLASQKAR